MAFLIVNPASTEIEHLASVDVKFSGAHIGGGIYFSANHNPTPGGSSTAIPERSLIGEGEPHATTELDYTLPTGGEPWDDYRGDIDGDGTLDFVMAGFDMALHIGDRLVSTGEFYDGPSAPLLIANDPNDLFGVVTITGYPSAANSLDGTSGTLHQTTGTLSLDGYTNQTVGVDAGGYFTVDGAEAVGGMSGGGNFLGFDADGDGTSETYLIGSAARAGTIIDDVTGDLIESFVQSTSFSPHYADLAEAIEGLTGSALRTADDFSRMTLLSAQTPGSLLTTVQGQFFHENIYGGINADTLLGAGGDDHLFGGDGADSIDGGTGSDRIDGGSGSDTLSGGTGADWFVGSGLSGGTTDIITDFAGTEDVIDLSTYFVTLDDVVLATTELGDGSILIALPLGMGGGTVQVLSTTIADLSSINVNVVCFTTGTLIKTQGGEVAVENLAVGDMVLTMDNNYRPIRWIGRKSLYIIDLTLHPKLAPVRISAGAIGNNIPETDLMVSPQHRVLVRSVIAERMFGTHEVLLPAIKLVELDGIEQVQDATEVTYWHMLFDGHEIVFSNGAPTESLFTGPEVLKSLSPETREEITQLFPEISVPGYVPTPARPIPAKGKLIKQLVARHAKNNKVLLTAEE
jgi:Ca2+-binding RTX toxin-like protein